jgi:pSer/pThr/pTyr-binding forkhead associated (FHA) protein
VASTTPSYALRFISGKYQGGEFPLVKGREIIIGRSSELDMVLIEDMVSRRHASISVTGDELNIADVGSTNGTFVNGEKIKKARLKEGDRILIGTSIIKLITVDPASQVSEAEAKNQLEKRGQQAGNKTTATNRAMSGSIEEIPLPDLLQLLSTSKRTGVLGLRGPQGNGQIYLRKGQIYYATIDDSYDMNPQKAAYRLLTWERGTFELDSADEKTFLEEIKDSTEGLLMEGMRQLDEFKRVEEDLPPRNAQLSIPRPLVAPLNKLTPDELEVFQIVLNGGNTQAVLDRSKKSDADAATGLISLIKREYVMSR